MERKSRILDEEKAKEMEDAEAEFQTNLVDSTEIFELPTEEVSS